MDKNLAQIGVAGDWHGNLPWALKTLDAFAAKGIYDIVHLGDFGIWPGERGASYVLKVQKCLTQNNQRLYVVPGNHEDYVRINNTQYGLDGLQHYHQNIMLFPRGYRFTVGGRTIVALGGGASIDFQGRTEGISWWKEEAITLGNVYKTISGGEADIMFAHDCAYGVPIPLSHRTHGGWPLAGINYAEESRMMMRAAVDGVKPKLFMHGHYHTHYDKDVVLNDGLVDYTTRFVGLNMDGNPQSNAILNLHTLELEVF